MLLHQAISVLKIPIESENEIIAWYKVIIHNSMYCENCMTKLTCIKNKSSLEKACLLANLTYDNFEFEIIQNDIEQFQYTLIKKEKHDH